MDLFGTIYNKTEYAHSIVSKYFGNFVIHVAMTELLMQLEVVPHFLHGSSIGIISAAYLSGSITLEEALHSVYLYTAFAHQVTGKAEHITQVRKDNTTLLRRCLNVQILTRIITSNMNSLSSPIQQTNQLCICKHIILPFRSTGILNIPHMAKEALTWLIWI